MPDGESTRLQSATKDELYRIGSRRDSYDDVVARLLALRQAVVEDPERSVDGYLSDAERAEEPRGADHVRRP